MHLRQLHIVLEQDRAYTRGKQVDWGKFKASLAASGGNFGTGDRFDSIIWLGMAGDPSGTLQGAYAKPAKLHHDEPLFGIVDAAGFFNPMTSNISMNPKSYPSWDVSSTDFSATLAHELRHRGFHICSKIGSIRDNFPSDVKDDIANFGLEGNKWNAEHKMLYAIQYGYGFSKFRSREEAQYWIDRYNECRRVVRGWLSSFSIPKDAPQALRTELEKIYGKPVELVAPGESPATTAQPVIVKPEVARAAPKPTQGVEDRRKLLIEQGMALLGKIKPQLQKIAQQSDNSAASAAAMVTMLQRRQFRKILSYLDSEGFSKGTELYDAVAKLIEIQNEIRKIKGQ